MKYNKSDVKEDLRFEFHIICEHGEVHSFYSPRQNMWDAVLGMSSIINRLKPVEMNIKVVNDKPISHE
jgi:hypothetical protein